MNELTIFTDFSQIAHVQGPGHPERPARLEQLRELLEEFDFPHGDVQPATRAQLETAHAPNHVAKLLGLAGNTATLDPDTRVGPPTIAAALSAAGCAIAAARNVMNGSTKRAFALVRPPGHHAESDRAMGFCYFNNVALMAEEALSCGAERVLIVDWDVHHGNGSQHTFESRSDVAVLNLHQWPFYPGSGALDEVGHGLGRGYTINCPMQAGSGDAEYLELFDKVVLPFGRTYLPDIILVSAGYDAHVRDPLGAMNVSDEGFGQFAARIRELASDVCEGRIAATLEGGYDLEGLVGGVATTLAAWSGVDTPVKRSRPTGRHPEIVEFHARS